MNQLTCDNCHKPIWNGTIYYKIRQTANGNDMFRDEEYDLCPDCARTLSADRTQAILAENEGEQIPITKWTPANDPPKESGRYLVYIVNEYDEQLQYIMTADYIARPKPIEGLSSWYVDDECASDNVVAWMPLPKGYK